MYNSGFLETVLNEQRCESVERSDSLSVLVTKLDEELCLVAMAVAVAVAVAVADVSPQLMFQMATEESLPPVTKYDLPCLSKISKERINSSCAFQNCLISVPNFHFVTPPIDPLKMNPFLEEANDKTSSWSSGSLIVSSSSLPPPREDRIPHSSLSNSLTSLNPVELNFQILATPSPAPVIKTPLSSNSFIE
ncbi:hypothetical protein WICPIJ_002184 [Wickerhamomyces pijperi]|uniref:Uncharacterized protein n=1 Tax=Wickerhamomyces pijperi TaxID=599730 RepID=A0A9P8QA84_WICPI|nr:hypothetical protein WICPIJ_002184 [Wickerhamomyces pijperi]